MSLTPDQLAMRSKGIGSSEIAVLEGLDDAYGNVHDLYDEKTSPGSVHRPDLLHLRIGAHMEELIARLYQEQTKREVVGFIDRNGEVMQWTIAHPEQTWMMASPDRFIPKSSRSPKRRLPFVHEESNALANPEAFDRLLEIKHITFTRDEWGEGEDAVPPRYRAQASWQMGVSGVHVCDLVALIGSNLRIYPLAFDPEYFARQQEIARRFWFDHVLGMVPPAVDESAGPSLLRRFPEAKREDLVQATDPVDELVAELFDARRRRDMWDAIVSKHENQLKSFIGEHQGAVGFNGEHWRARWMNRKGSTSWKKVLEAIVADPSLLDLGLERLSDKFRGAPTRAFDLDRYTPKGVRK